VARAAGRRALLTASLVLAARPALAHDETVSTSDVTVEARTVVWRVDVGVAGLARALHLPGPADAVTERDLAAARTAIARYVVSGLTVILDGRQIPAEVGALEPLYDDDVASRARPGVPGRVVLTLRFPAGQVIESLRCRVAFFADLTNQHRAMVTVRWGGGVRRLVRLGPAELELRRSAFATDGTAVVREFMRWGTEHIFLGYDHLAFLLALLLVAVGWREVLAIVTSFTVAHSLTLLLSALDLVRIPSRLTEVLIAASIVYVAAENLLLLRRQRAPRQRWMLTFAFGLVHGLGFATLLRQRLATVPGGVLAPVLSFNVGVELGQLAIVLAVFPLLSAVRRRGQAARTLLVRWGSTAVLLLGLGWLVERLLF
jgi:hydrogenase/urease accessory protein HupE